MKKTTFIIILLIIFKPGFAQKENNTNITTVNISVYNPDFNNAVETLKNFFKKTSASTVFLKKTQSKITTQFYKGKRILLDNKVSYFVPFAYNREFRSLAYSASFNLVF